MSPANASELAKTLTSAKAFSAKVNAQTQARHFDKIGRAGNNNTSFYMLGWIPNGYDALDILMNVMTPAGHGPGRGEWNSGRYDNARVTALTDAIKTETDQKRRNELIREAFKIHQDEVGHIPLHQQALAWGVRDTVAKIWQRPFDDVDLRYVTMK